MNRMNRKGLLNLFFYFCVLVVIACALAFQSYNNNDMALSFKNNISNTFSNWNYSNITSLTNLQTNENPLISSIGDFGYFCLKTISKFTVILVDWTYNNQDVINPRLLMTLVILSLLAPLIYPAFIIIVSLILIFKEWRAKKREKKALDKLKRGINNDNKR